MHQLRKENSRIINPNFMQINYWVRRERIGKDIKQKLQNIELSPLETKGGSFSKAYSKKNFNWKKDNWVTITLHPFRHSKQILQQRATVESLLLLSLEKQRKISHQKHREKSGRRCLQEQQLLHRNASRLTQWNTKKPRVRQPNSHSRINWAEGGRNWKGGPQTRSQMQKSSIV